MTRIFGFASSRVAREPMWSKSVWVSQIQRSWPGSITDAERGHESVRPATVPVSTRSGLAAVQHEGVDGERAERRDVGGRR